MKETYLTIKEPERKVSIYASADVLVVGGGPAGVSAAIASARNGAKTILLERYGYLGGMATGGLVILIPHLSDGTKKQWIAGLCQEIIDRLDDIGGVLHPKYEDLGSSDPDLLTVWSEYLFFTIGGKVRLSAIVDPQVLKCVLDSMMEEAGVKLCFHCWAVQALMDNNKIKGVVFESKSGQKAIMAKIIIDATGDGDIFASAGTSFNDVPDLTLRTSTLGLICRIGNVDTKKYSDFMKKESRKYAELMNQLEAMGGFSLILKSNQEDVVWVNNYFPKWKPNYIESFVKEETEKKQLSALNFEDLTFVEISARKGIMVTINFLKKYIPGFEKSFILEIAPQIGTRGSRRLVGEYIVTKEDVFSGIMHEDTIAVCPPINGNISKEHPLAYIPFRSLLPRKLENLIVAGRCFSSDQVANDILNIIPFCIAMGQAAGTAAAIAAKANIIPKDINYTLLKQQLINQNVPLPE